MDMQISIMFKGGLTFTYEFKSLKSLSDAAKPGFLLQPKLKLNSTQKLGKNDFRPPPTPTQHRPPHKLNVINISAVPAPIFTKL